MNSSMGHFAALHAIDHDDKSTRTELPLGVVMVKRRKLGRKLKKKGQTFYSPSY
jgi:hypothetical protein